MIVRTLWGAVVLVGLHALAIRLGIVEWVAQIDLSRLGCVLALVSLATVGSWLAIDLFSDQRTESKNVRQWEMRQVWQTLVVTTLLAGSHLTILLASFCQYGYPHYLELDWFVFVYFATNVSVGIVSVSAVVIARELVQQWLRRASTATGQDPCPTDLGCVG